MSAPSGGGGDSNGSIPLPEIILSPPEGGSQRSSVHTSGSTPAMTPRPTWQRLAMRNLQVDDPSLLRGMPVAVGLRNFASTLSDRPATAKYFELSAPVDHIDTFVSHNWNTPRWKKFLVLALHFNLCVAIVTSLAVAITCCVLTVQGLLPHVDIQLATVNNGDAYSRGLLCLPCGATTFLVVLFTGHEAARLCTPCSRQHNIFLDKTCVQQVDLELKRKGIQCLAAFVRLSTDFLVLYSRIYFRRLWTTYEVATWLMLHRGEKLIARPLFAPLVILCGFMGQWAQLSFVLLSGVSKISSSGPPFLGYLALLLCVLPSMTLLAFLGARWADDCDSIEQDLAEFRLADALCASEEDRATLQRNIRAFMKLSNLSEHDASDEQIYRSFEELVRREVPHLMLRSFGRVGVPYLWALVTGFPRVLWMFDFIAGSLEGSETLRYTGAWCLFHAGMVISIFPLTFAFSLLVAAQPRLRTVPACLANGVCTGGLFFGLAYLLTGMTERALVDDFWFLALIFTHIFFAFTVAIVYWPGSLVVGPTGSA